MTGTEYITVYFVVSLLQQIYGDTWGLEGKEGRHARHAHGAEDAPQCR